MEADKNGYSYWADHDLLVRTKGDKAWALWNNPIKWSEWKWRNEFANIGDWKWRLENRELTLEEAKRHMKTYYNLDKIPA